MSAPDPLSVCKANLAATEEALAEARRELVYTEERLEAADARWESVAKLSRDGRYSDEFVGIVFRRKPPYPPKETA